MALWLSGPLALLDSRKKLGHNPAGDTRHEYSHSQVHRARDCKFDLSTLPSCQLFPVPDPSLNLRTGAGQPTLILLLPPSLLQVLLVDVHIGRSFLPFSFLVLCLLLSFALRAAVGTLTGPLQSRGHLLASDPSTIMVLGRFPEGEVAVAELTRDATAEFNKSQSLSRLN